MRIPSLAALSAVCLGSLALSLPPDAPRCEVPERPTDAPATCGLTLVGALDLEDGGTGQVAVRDDLAAVVLRDAGRVALVDVADLTAPVLLATYDGGTGIAQLDHPLDGDVAFSADGTLLFHARQTSDASNEGLHVLDVTDPTAPVRVDLAPQGGMLRVATAVVDGRELVVTQDAIGGLTVLESVRTPVGARVVPLWADPLPALKVGGPASAGLVLHPEDPLTGGPLLVATDGTTGLRLLDLTDPGAPVEFGAWDVQGLADVVVEWRDGRRLVHAATEYWFDGTTPPRIITLDTTDPADIVELHRTDVGSYDGSDAWRLGGLAMDGGDLVVAHGAAGVMATPPSGLMGPITASTVDLGRPTIGHPTYGVLPRFALDVAVVDGHWLVTDGTTGELRIFRRD